MDVNSGASGSVWRFDGEMALFLISLGLAINTRASWRGFWRWTGGELRDSPNRNTLKGIFYK